MEKNYWEHSHKWFLCPNYSAFSISHPSEDTSHVQGEGECLWPSVILLTRAFNWDTFLHPTLGVTFRYVICSWVTGKLCLTSAEMCKCLIRFNNYLLERQFCRKIPVTEKWKEHKKNLYCNWTIAVLAELIHLSRNIFINTLIMNVTL